MGVTVTIGGAAVRVIDQSVQTHETQDGNCTAQFVVLDATGAAYYQAGQEVSIIDSTFSYTYTGYIHDTALVNLYPNADNEITVNCMDGHYIPGKRYYSGPEWSNMYAGDIATDLFNKVLHAEGITASYAARNDQTLANWQQGTLTNTLATTNNGGDIELALAGSDLEIIADFTQGTLTNCAYSSGVLAPVSTPAIKITGIQSVAGASNSYAYVKIWQGSAPTMNNHYLAYDIWIDPSSPQAEIGVDIVYTDGTTLRDNVVYFDLQNLSPHPAIDQKGVASGQWYHRLFFLGNMNGKTIAYVSLAIEGDNAGTYTAWIKNIDLLDINRSIVQAFFSTTLNTVQPMQANGYYGVMVSVVNTYDLPSYSTQLIGAWTPTNYGVYWTFEDWGYEGSGTPRTPPNWFNSFSVNTVSILKSSFVSWEATEPTNTQVVISYSWDGTAYTQATNNAALPNMRAGLNMTGKTLYLCVQFFRAASSSSSSGTITPEVAPSLSLLETTLESAYNATKTDVLSSWLHNVDWQGTFNGTLASALLDNQQPHQVPQYTWSSGGVLSGFDLFSTSGAAAQAGTSSGVQLTTGANSDIRLRATANGQYTNGIVDVYVTVSASVAGGVVYRTSNWGNNNDSYAYSATLTTTQVLLGRGTNSTGAGAFTSLGTATVSLTAGTQHALTVIFISGTHQVFVDRQPVLTIQDTTYLGSGYVGLRAFNSGGSTASVTLQFLTTYAGNALSLYGAVRNWDDGINSGQSVWTTNGTQSQNQKALQIAAPANGEARSRMDFAGQYDNFILETDIYLDSSGAAPGFVYRCSNWQNADSSWAYAVEVTLTSVKINRGNNSSSGTPPAPTTIASASLSLSSGNWHHVKAVVSGSSHTIYLDDTQVLNVTDGTYTAPGYVGLRNRAPAGAAYNALFDNFGICTALSGTWTSNSISLSSAGTYGNSMISWRDMSTNTADCTLLVQTSIDGGSTYQTCTNGAAIPGFTAGQSLSGVSLLVKVTLTTTTASSLPMIDNLIVQVLGAYSASGSRVSPVLSLSSVGARAGNTLAAWNGLQPANTSILIDTSLDGSTWSNVGSGASGSAQIAGISVQPEPVIDQFGTNDIANYINTNATGGAAASWTFDTSHNRISVSGGTYALLVYNSSTTGADIDLSCILDYSDNGGLCWRYTSGSNYYDVMIHDASSATAPNTIALFKTVSGTRTQITSAAISFNRNDPHIVRIIHQGSALTISFDGSAVISTTENSLSSAGKCGIANNGSTAHFYLLRVQFYGDDVSSTNVYSRVRLTSTDPTATPAVESLALSCRANTIQNGVLVPSTKYSVMTGNNFYSSQILDDLAKQSNNYWWRIKQGIPYFQALQSTPAPFVLTKKDTLVQNLEIDDDQDVYRNSQWINNVVDTFTRAVNFIGDGVTTSFDLGYPVDSIDDIVLNNIVQSVGIKSVDTGKDWYYKVGDSTLVQDSSASPINNTQTLSVVFEAQTNAVINILNDVEIARIAALDGTTGIIDELEDGSGLDKLGALSKGYGLIQQYAQTRRTAKFETLRAGLAVGQLLAIFLAPIGVFAGAFLVTDVQTTWYTTNQNGTNIIQPWYTVQAVDGPIIGDWTRFINNLAG